MCRFGLGSSGARPPSREPQERVKTGEKGEKEGFIPCFKPVMSLSHRFELKGAFKVLSRLFTPQEEIPVIPGLRRVLASFLPFIPGLYPSWYDYSRSGPSHPGAIPACFSQTGRKMRN